MAYVNNILLGRITKISGYEGAVTVRLEKFFIENIPQMESVFIETDGRPVPFFIAGYEYSGADVIKVRFDGYDTIEKISEFIGSRVFLTSEVTDTVPAGEMPDLTGYMVVINDDRPVGSINEVIRNPGQWLLSILSDSDREILIPLHEDFIVSIDEEEKIIKMVIPDGLTDIN